MCLGSLALRTKKKHCISVCLRFCPGVPAHKGITIVLSLFRSPWLAVVYCLVYCIGSCEPVHEDRAVFELACFKNEEYSLYLAFVWACTL